MTQPAPLHARPLSIALVDVSYLFKKRWHLNDGSKNAAAHGVLRDLAKLRDSTGPGSAEHIIICRDMPPYKRTEVFPAYKANRPEREPEEIAQARHLYAEIQRLGYSVAGVRGYEADDVIATLATQYAEWCDDVRIVGPDKDCAQLIGDRVKQFIPPPTFDADWVVRDVEAVKQKWGVTPPQMRLYQALVGDASDNIPGVNRVGPATAKELVNKYGTLQRLAEALATLDAKPAIRTSLIDNWNNLVLSLQLVTLDTAVPLDAEELLVTRAALPPKEDDSMNIGNDNSVDPHPGFDEAVRAYQDKLPELQKTEAAREEETEEHYEEERKQNGEHVDAKTEVVEAEPAPTQRRRQSGIITVPAYTQSTHGLVTSSLQPLDLQSAEVLAKWLASGEMYVKKFKSAAQIFTIIQKARELGLPITVVLDNYHIVDGKPCPSADLIRALAERDASFGYLMPVEQGPTRCTWEGRNTRHPRAVSYTYTIEEAMAAGLCRPAPSGKPSNWVIRPTDMLNKTAASKLARQLWPGATMGLYCLEEMGYSESDVDVAA
jgi:5'-3' exonuclease